MAAASSRGRRGVLRRQLQCQGQRGAHLSVVAAAPGTARRIATTASAPGSAWRTSGGGSLGTEDGGGAAEVAAARPQPVPASCKLTLRGGGVW